MYSVDVQLEMPVDGVLLCCSPAGVARSALTLSSCQDVLRFLNWPQCHSVEQPKLNLSSFVTVAAC